MAQSTNHRQLWQNMLFFHRQKKSYKAVKFEFYLHVYDLAKYISKI